MEGGSLSVSDPVLKEIGHASFIERIGLSPDPFQLKAFAAIDMDRSVLVAAPTGSGKTLVAQYAVDRSLSLGWRSFYTTPLKALSNQKYQEFTEIYGERRVGLLTGDNVINPGADVVIMTTEVLRNMLYEGASDLSRLGYVIMDEVHYLQNPYRGAVWEEVIIHLPETVSLVCLSATVSNSDEFGDWIRTVRGPTDVVVETERPVELVHLYGVADGRGRDFKVFEAILEDKANPDCSRYDDPRAAAAFVRRRAAVRAATPRRLDVLDYLRDSSMLPAVFFIFSRQGCDLAVEHMVRSGVRLTSTNERAEIRRIVDETITSLSTRDLDALGFSSFMAGLEAGVAAHHAGMVPPLKEAVEKCFARALVKVVFATETLSLGINMPARSVVIEKLTKFNGESHEMLTAGEYTQLAGRAGRRGIDEIGYSLALWSPFVPFEQVAHLMVTRSYPLTSSFRPTYNMAANLVKSFDPEVARNLLNLSFAQFRSDAEVVHLEARLAKLRGEEESLVDQAHCEFGDVASLWALTKRDGERAEPLATAPSERHIRLHAARLRPGDVLCVPSAGDSGIPTRVVVVATSRKKGGRIVVWIVTAAGEKLAMRGNQIDFIPKPAARLEVGVEYNPRDPGYLAAMAEALREMRIANCSTEEPRFNRTSVMPPRPSVSKAEVAELREKLKQCPDFNRHLNAVKRLERIAETSTKIKESVKRQTESLARQFDRVLAVLSELGFVDGWELTPSGEKLAGLFHESDLLVALALERGVFDGLEPEELASLLSVFVYEPRNSAPGSDHFPSLRMEERFREIAALRVELVRAEGRLRIPATRAVESGFMVYASAWARGRDLETVLGDRGMPGGDFVRNLKQIIDLARQLGNAVPDPEMSRRFHAVDKILCRGVVEASIRVNR